MASTRLSSRGRVVIPQRLRESHGWEPGTEFAVEEVAAGILLRPRRLFPPTGLEAGRGCAGYRGPAKTLEEMEEAVAADLPDRPARRRKE